MFSHEQEQNKFRPSSIGDKIKITAKIHQRSPGGDWTTTMKSLQDILGDKRATCYRWVCLARDLDEAVLRHINIRRKNLMAGFVTDNKYLLGRGEAARFKLNSDFAAVALDRLIDNLEGGKTVTAKDFQENYCRAFRQLETWQTSQIKRFGRIAVEFPAFARVVKSLSTEQGRHKLIMCLTQRLAISGSDGDSHYGIEEARAVVLEMQKMKAGADPKQHGTAGGVSPEENTGGVSPGEKQNDPSQPTSADAMDIDDGDLLADEPEEKQEDPILQKAEALADAESTHICIHTDRQEFQKDVESRVLSTHKALIVIEAPSSKPKVFNDLLRMTEKFKLNAAYYIPCSNRCDLLSVVHSSLCIRFPKRPIFVIQFGFPTQTTYTRSMFGIYLPAVGSSSAGAPGFVSLAGCRAKASECLRLRCMDPKCKFRGDQDANDDPDAANADLNDDDQEFGDFDSRDTVEDEEPDEGELALAAVEPADAATDGAGSKFKRNLFPFASPVAVHSKVLHQVANASSLSHLIVLTRSAHPGLFIAGRQCKLEMIALIQGVKEHCLAHGRELLRTMLISIKYPDAKQQVGVTSTVKRIRASSLPFIVVKAPEKEQQLILMREVEPDPASSWRMGFNKRPLAVEEKMIVLLQKELCDHAFMLSKDSEGVLSLVTMKARREGEELFPLRGL